MKKMKNDTLIEEKNSIETKQPSLYTVVVLNDDYTPMDYVVSLLQKIFNFDDSTATRKMFEIHVTGSSCCGSFSKDIASSKSNILNQRAREDGHPLISRIERI